MEALTSRNLNRWNREVQRRVFHGGTGNRKKKLPKNFIPLLPFVFFFAMVKCDEFSLGFNKE